MSRSIRTNIRRGLSLVEVMISLAISATLLTAIAAAFSASSQAIETNDHVFRATQAARVTINQITTEVRNCKSGAVSSTTLDLITGTDEARLYEYNSVKKEIQITFPDIDPDTKYTLARNVSAARFYTDGDAIALSITIEVGTNKVTLSGSAFPRRTLTFD